MPRVSSTPKTNLYDDSKLDVIIEEDTEVDQERKSIQKSGLSKKADSSPGKKILYETSSFQPGGLGEMGVVKETISSSSTSDSRGNHHYQEEDEEPRKKSSLKSPPLSPFNASAALKMKHSIPGMTPVNYNRNQSSNSSPTVSANDDGKVLAIYPESSVLNCPHYIQDYEDENCDSYDDSSDSESTSASYLIDPTMLDSSSDESEEDDYYQSVVTKTEQYQTNTYEVSRHRYENNKDESSMSEASMDCLSYSTPSRITLVDYEHLDSLMNNTSDTTAMEILLQQKASLQESSYHRYTSPVSRHRRRPNQNSQFSIDYGDSADPLNVNSSALSLFQETSVAVDHVQSRTHGTFTNGKDDPSLPPPPSLCGDDEIAEEIEKEEGRRFNLMLKQRKESFYLSNNLGTPSSPPKLSQTQLSRHHNHLRTINNPESSFQLSPSMHVNTISPEKCIDSSTISTISATYCNSSSSCRSYDSFDMQSSYKTPDYQNFSRGHNVVTPNSAHYVKDPPNYRDVSLDNITNANYPDFNSKPLSSGKANRSDLEILFPGSRDSHSLEHQIYDTPKQFSPSFLCQDELSIPPPDEEDKIVESFYPYILSCTQDLLINGIGLGEDGNIYLNILDCPHTDYQHKINSCTKRYMKMPNSNINDTKLNVRNPPNRRDLLVSSPTERISNLEVSRKNYKKPPRMKSLFRNHKNKTNFMKNKERDYDNDNGTYFKSKNKRHENAHHVSSNKGMERWGNVIVQETIEQMRSFQIGHMTDAPSTVVAKSNRINEPSFKSLSTDNDVTTNTSQSRKTRLPFRMHDVDNKTTSKKIVSPSTIRGAIRTMSIPSLAGTNSNESDINKDRDAGNLSKNSGSRGIRDSLKKSNSNSSLMVGSALFSETSIDDKSGPISHKRLETLKEQVFSSLKKTDFRTAINGLTQLLHLVLLNRGIPYSERFLGLLMYVRGLVHLIIGGSKTDGNYRCAVKDFEDAAAKFRPLANCDKEYLWTKLKLGVSYYAQEDFLISLRLFEEALEIISFNPSKISSSRLLFAEVINNIACIEYVIGRKCDSLKNFKKSLSIQSSITKEGIYNINTIGNENIHPKKCVSFNFSITLCNLGIVQLMSKKGVSSAIQSFENAVTRQQQFSDNDNYYSLSAIEYLAIANIRIGHLQNSMKLYNCILQIYIEKFGPLHEECVLILSKINLINLFKSKRKPDASSVGEILEHLSEREDSRSLLRFMNVLLSCNFVGRDLVDKYYDRL